MSSHNKQSRLCLQKFRNPISIIGGDTADSAKYLHNTNKRGFIETTNTGSLKTELSVQSLLGNN